MVYTHSQNKIWLPKIYIQASWIGMIKWLWKFKDHPINHTHPTHAWLNSSQLLPTHVSHPNPFTKSIPLPPIHIPYLNPFHLTKLYSIPIIHLIFLILPLPLTREINLIPHPCLCIILHLHTPSIQHLYLHILPQSIIPILHLIPNLHIILVLIHIIPILQVLSS